MTSIFLQCTVPEFKPIEPLIQGLKNKYSGSILFEHLQENEVATVDGWVHLIWLVWITSGAHQAELETVWRESVELRNYSPSLLSDLRSTPQVKIYTFNHI